MIGGNMRSDKMIINYMRNNQFISNDFIEKKFAGKNKIVFKEDAAKNKFIIKFLKWFFNLIQKITKNKFDFDFMRRTTTIKRTIYIGNGFKELIVNESHNKYIDADFYKLIRHELKHIGQYNKFNFLYELSYISNIWFIVLPIISLLIGLSAWAVLGIALASLLLPAGLSLRGYWELEAFTYGEKKLNELNVLDYCQVKDVVIDAITRYLTSSNYYFALSFIKKIVRKNVEQRITDFCQKGD